jgi:hypothetical protein
MWVRSAAIKGPRRRRVPHIILRVLAELTAPLDNA